jgi:hypothetical protein
MRPVILIFVLVLASAGLYAQRPATMIISGKVTDSISVPLESATVSLYDLQDSALHNYTLTDNKGSFRFRSVPVAKRMNLVISYHGYKTVVKSLFRDAGGELKLDTFKLEKSYTELDEVVVTAEKPPVVFKKDTIEFNAGSFRTKTNAVVEDLLKQLPGVEVDKEGNITVNGKAVSKITVDGKEFFGGDPLIATKNLPKDIVDKIQVSDNKSKEAIFNKTTDGTEDKAINITLKKDRNKGWFGRATAGYGSDERYEAGASINYFNRKNQMNFIGSMNNTNRMNFGNGGGRNNPGGGNGRGITESASAGMNFSTSSGEKLRLNGSYFYNRSQSVNNTRRKRENILPDTSFYYIAANSNTNRYSGHNLTVNGDIDLDTLTHLNFHISFNDNDGKSNADNNSFSENLGGQRINSSVTRYTAHTGNQGLGASMFLSHRFRKKGRGITFTAGYNNNQSDGLSDNIGLNTFTTGSGVENDTLNQRGYDDNKSTGYNLSVTWTEPLVTDVNVLFTARYNQSHAVSDRQTYNINEQSEKYDLIDSALSNAFRNNNESLAPGISFNIHKKKLNASLGNSVSFLTQENYSMTRDSLFQQRFVNFFPTANFGYQFSNTRQINFNYNGRTQQPSIQQLQPVADNRNPLYIRLGNPDLQPSFMHSLSLSMNAQKPDRKIFVSGGLNYSSTMNQIVQEVYYDSVGRQVSRPVNTNGNHNSSFFMNMGKNWKAKTWMLKMNISTSLNAGRSTVFSNKILNRANSYGVSGAFGVGFELNDKFSIQPRYTGRFNDTKYSIEQKGQVASSVTHNFSLDFDVHITKRVTIETDINTNYNNRIAPGFRKSVTNWTAAINWKVLRKEQGNIRFIIYDILKQNTSVFRNISQTYIEDVEMDVLQQYFLVSFTYNLKKFRK